MLTIGICDDGLLCRRLLVELINQYAEEHEQFRQIGPLQVVSKPCTLGYIETIFEMVLTKP